MYMHELKQSMRVWQRPAELKVKLDAAWASYGASLITGRDTQFWRETTNGAEFAELVGAQAVRLGSDPPDIELLLDGQVRQVEVVEALRGGRRRDQEYRQDARIEQALRGGEPIRATDRQRAGLVALPPARNEVERGATATLAAGVELTPEQALIVAQLLAERSPDTFLWWPEPDELHLDEGKVARAALAGAAKTKAAKGYNPNFWLLVYLNPGMIFESSELVEGMLVEASEPARHAFSQVWVLWRGSAFQTWQAGERGRVTLRRADAAAPPASRFALARQAARGRNSLTTEEIMKMTRGEDWGDPD
jgi:hypothetical protein